MSALSVRAAGEHGQREPGSNSVPKEDGAVPAYCEGAVRQPEEDALPVLGPARKGRSLELSRVEIVRRLRSGEAVRLDEEPAESLFDRFMNGTDGQARSLSAGSAHPRGSRRDGVSGMA